MIVTIIGALALTALPRETQAMGPSFTIGDIPRIIEKAWKNNKDMIKAQLRVVQDVAYKTALRLFYAQLAQQAYLFASGAGSGQNPLFITNGNYWRNLGEAAKNDFIDNLNTEYFGKNVPATSAESQKQLGLFIRGIFNKGTVCEDGCQDAYNYTDGRAKTAQLDLKAIQDNNQEALAASGTSGPYITKCPITYQVAPDGKTRIPEYRPSADSQLHPKVCVKDLETAISNLRNEATRVYSACTRSCREKRQQADTATIDPRFNEMVGNEAVAAGVSDWFSVDQNQFGQAMNLVEEVQEKGAARVMDERVSSTSSIQALRTVAGVVKAPVNVTGKASEKGLEESTAAEPVYTGSKAADIIIKAAGKGLYERLLKFLMQQCGLNPQACKNPSGTSPQARAIFSGAGFGAPSLVSGTQAGQLITTSIGRTDLIAGDPSRNPIAKTEDLASLGIIDQRFAQAVDQRLRLQEAVDQGYIDADKTFGFDVQGRQPTDGISYRTILYLRQARIVPVGWELAAEYMVNYKPANRGLGELMAQYNMCGQDAAHDYDPGVKKCSGGGDRDNTSCTIDDNCVQVSAYPTDSCDATNHCVQKTDRSCTNNTDCTDERGVCIDQLTASPFCGLVDPNWVLKAPLSYCKKSGAGEEIFMKNFICDEDTNGNGRVDCGKGTGGGDIGHYEITRKTEVCADEPTCIAENDDGTCKSYGYCFEDKPTIRFNGTQCPSYYASCQAFTDPNGTTVAYLKNTIDVNGCSADNAGCLGYCRDRAKTSKAWLCMSEQQISDQNDDIAAGRVPPGLKGVLCPNGDTCTCTLPNGISCTVNGGQRSCTVPGAPTCFLGTNYVYFDRDAQSCDAANEGCREFINPTPSSNLVPNGGFEQYSGTIDVAGVETIRGWSDAEVVTSDLQLGRNNVAAVRLRMFGPVLRFTNDRVAPDPVGIDLGRPLSKATVTLSYYAKATDQCGGRFGIQSADGRYVETSTVGAYATAWTRYTQRFEFPEDTYGSDFLSVFVESPSAGPNCDLDVDNVQLETTANPTEYKDYGTVNKTYLKGSRKSCDRNDVGCEKYTPVAGGDAITGVVNAADQCSQEHASCQQFRKEPTDRIPLRPAVDGVNVVVNSARTCSAADIGCEEYTNLDVAARGGEAREYFTAIRQCVKPVTGNTSQRTYFSWIGDDRTGFQLKSYRLKKSNLDDAPCTNLKVGAIAEGNNPDCVDTGTTVRDCTSADLNTNPDCTQFFDSDGTVFYRLQSYTVPVTDECQAYRNTIDERSGLDKVYLIQGTQSLRCAQEVAECRQFTGNTGNNGRNVFSDTYEGSNTVAANWAEVGCAAPGTCAQLSTESLSASGHSMSVNGTVATVTSVLKDKIRNGATYVLTFWAKPLNAGTRLSEAFIHPSASADAPLISAAKDLANDWHPYTIGPVSITSDLSAQDVELRLRTSDTVFLDNVTLKELTDALFLVDNSFRTCPDSELGCQAYSTRQNQPIYIKNFTRLCSPDVVGCSALIDTQNSSDPFRGLPIRGISTPPDQTVPVVVEPGSVCAADQKGCSAFGLSNLDVQKRVASFKDVYLKDQPDLYSTTLCSVEELQCTEYSADTGGKSYFRDPGVQTCEYKRLGGQTDYHWFVSGTSMRCPTSPQYAVETPSGRACVKSCDGGARRGLACTTGQDCPGLCEDQGGVKICVGGARNSLNCGNDDDCPASCIGDDAKVGRSCTVTTARADCGTDGDICDLWTGLCPEEQSGCNEYRDPTDPKQCRSECGFQSSPNGSEIPLDETCHPTLCRGGKKDGAYCYNNADCPGKCNGGDNDGEACTSDRDCPSPTGDKPCITSMCSGEGIPGCRSYYYLRQTVEAGASACNGRVDSAIGCRAFNDTSNPTLNFRAQ